MSLEQHYRRLELITQKYAGGTYNAALTDLSLRLSILPVAQEEELRDLESLIKIEGKRWL